MLMIHDKRLPEEYKDALRQKLADITFISLDTSKGKVYNSIRCHPDIYFFQFDEKTLIYAPCVPSGILENLRRAGVKLIKGEKSPGCKYPGTSLYNAVRIGEVIFHNFKYTDRSILTAAENSGLNSINVSQGYTRCSVVPVSKRAIITQDRVIAASAKEAGIEVLLISSGGVLLPGEDQGFIGGASGKMISGQVIMLGDISKHPDGCVIRKFMTEHAYEVIDLEGLPLYDAGSIMFF